MLVNYLPIFVLFVVVAIIGVALLLLPLALGPSRPTKTKSLPYECGWDPESNPRSPFSIRFYRLALLFLVFDIEAAFFYPWAIMFRDLSCKGQLQNGVCKGGATPFGLLVMVVFLAILVLALVFVWRRRALEWD